MLKLLTNKLFASNTSLEHPLEHPLIGPRTLSRTLTLSDIVFSKEGEPGKEATEAERWLAERLTFPCRIGLLIREWCGQRDGDTGRWAADLNKARAAMGVVAYEEADGKMWWRLPHATVQ